MAKYRDISSAEIEVLEKQHCRCDDWSLIKVVDGFNPHTIRNVNFSGDVKLGCFEKEFELKSKIIKKSGIYNATIHNCTIEDNVYINQIRSYIANYHIEKEVYLDNVDILAVEDNPAFGNGTEVSSICETGGREVYIYDYLSSQTAYVLAMYRDNKKLVNSLNKLILDYAESKKSYVGRIGTKTIINNCRTIKNVLFGEYATVENAFLLKNGSVNSTIEDKTYVGFGVIAKDFIISPGAYVSDCTYIDHCFIGQGCVLAKQYSAEHSLFFANCAGYHGEACAVFAGPFTVTHHKSSLLIAGYFSFMNTGSGSNQSNHMYKLGPIHQGILERGTKTTSNSYVLWPAKVGAFSVIVGRHLSHPDTDKLPFSYLIEEANETILVPGVNLQSIGTVRDMYKWPKRDKRNPKKKIDCINFNLLSPYVGEKILKGLKILKDFESFETTSTWFKYNNVKIKSESLRKGISLYEIALYKHIGELLADRLKNNKFESLDEIKTILKPTGDIGVGDWVDVGGMFAPKSEILKIISKIISNNLPLKDINKEFRRVYFNYNEYEWNWAYFTLEKIRDKKIDEFSIENFVDVLTKWIESENRLGELICKNADKEFSKISKISFGIDGGEEEIRKDFNNIRGNINSNPDIIQFKANLKELNKLYADLIVKLNKAK